MDAIGKTARSTGGVSAPLSVQHKVHGGFDKTGGFTGLPKEWETMLTSAGIGAKEFAEHKPQAMQAIQFYENYLKEEEARDAKARAKAAQGGGSGGAYATQQQSLVQPFNAKTTTSNGSSRIPAVAAPEPAKPAAKGIPAPRGGGGGGSVRGGGTGRGTLRATKRLPPTPPSPSSGFSLSQGNVPTREAQQKAASPSPAASRNTVVMPLPAEKELVLSASHPLNHFFTRVVNCWGIR
jgi:hypothetical protein